MSNQQAVWECVNITLLIVNQIENACSTIIIQKDAHEKKIVFYNLRIYKRPTT